MRNLFGILSLSVFSFTLCAAEPDSVPEKSENLWAWELMQMKKLNDTIHLSIIDASQLYAERWDTLAHPMFWKQIMLLSPDSCLINIAKNRDVAAKMSIKDWDKFSDEQKDVYRDSLRKAKGLSAEDKIYMTSGKNDFYQFDAVLPSVGKGVAVFNEIGVDPWYAQAILMIESPGKIAKSNVGAYGPFQLMPGVARSHGLRVDKTVDERKDFTKSAKGAASLIAKVCIPEARKILAAHNIEFNENDLWFRLFVLHIYHAGAGNVASVMNVIQPEKGGGELIQTMWTSTGGQFKNASQNYSQLALAALLILDEIIWERCEDLEDHTAEKL
jgi:hypothetical protein